MAVMALGAFVAVLGPPCLRADTLELKSGQIIKGQFLAGSELNIRFLVDGKEQIFATKDVLDLAFYDITVPPDADAISETNSAARQSSQSPTIITITAGTSVTVRMIDTVDSGTNKVGDTFRGSLESNLVVDGTVAAPKGADVYGKLIQAKEPGKISGAAELTLELTGIRISGKVVPVDSTDYDVAGRGRGKESAERIGGGAVLGAIIGGIAGGGRGAAIGAGAGAGVGTGVQLMTHGEKIRIPSETLLEFKLQHDVVAQVVHPETSN
jgi:hypothetical protein